ncbi:hypothetical protein [Pedobacter sp. Leaf194]|nr:hypothetical protein [Pedobacter sp. Leaf194]
MKLIKIQKRVMFTFKSKRSAGKFTTGSTAACDPTMGTLTSTLTGLLQNH